MNKKTLRPLFWFAAALVIAFISYAYVPDTIRTAAVDDITLRGLDIHSDVHYMYVGDRAQLTFSMTPPDAINAVRWESSDVSVVRVSQNGDIKALSSGDAVITLSDPSGVDTQVELCVINKPLPTDSDLPPLYYEHFMLANADNALAADYEPELEVVPSRYPQNNYYSQMRLTPEALEAYKELFAAAKSATGRSIYLNSSYRSYQRQTELYNEDVAEYRARGYSLEEAKRLTEKSTQIPGHSEHQLGVSIDVSLDGSFVTFRNTSLYKWLINHAHEYGWVLRYPSDKTELTGIDHEWWHFRYVGKGHAKYIYEHDLCMEEYVALQAQTAAAIEEFSSGVSADEYMEWLLSQDGFSAIDPN